MTNLKPKRVVVTGLGAITPVGNTSKEYWEGLLTGRNGIGNISRFDPSEHACKIAGEVKNFDPHHYMDRKEAKRMARFAQFAVAASKQAIADAKFEINDLNAEQVGITIGTGTGGIVVLEEQQKVYLSRGPSRCSPFMVPMMIANMAAGLTAIHIGAKGPNSCPVTACAAGSNGVGDAFRLIQRGYAQAMICGGTEAAVTPLSVAGFASARALSTRNDPLNACRPFDRDRDGFVMGEGAGILLLEELEHARSRGARIYAEIVGYGMTCDAYHITAPVPGGKGAARAIQLALKDAQIEADRVDYINAHGTSTPANDSTETQAIKTALGEDNARKVAISSTKSMTGHLLGGSGGIEAVATVLAIANDRMPPTINIENPDPDCDLDYIPHQSREKVVNVALSNSFGFGGHNVTLVFKKYTESEKMGNRNSGDGSEV